MAVAQAYEVLKDDETRADYDNMLDHPEQYYSHVYQYYRRKATPKIGLGPTIITILTLFSIGQYLYWTSRNRRALAYLMTDVKIIAKARQEAAEQGLLVPGQSKEESDDTIRKIVLSKVDLRGSFAPPSLWDVLWVQIFFWPYYIVKYFYWFGNWIYRIDVKKQPYTDDDKVYIVCKRLRISHVSYRLTWLLS